jgi:hypothetical protein
MVGLSMLIVWVWLAVLVVVDGWLVRSGQMLKPKCGIRLLSTHRPHDFQRKAHTSWIKLSGKDDDFIDTSVEGDENVDAVNESVSGTNGMSEKEIMDFIAKRVDEKKKIDPNYNPLEDTELRDILNKSNRPTSKFGEWQELFQKAAAAILESTAQLSESDMVELEAYASSLSIDQKRSILDNPQSEWFKNHLKDPIPEITSEQEQQVQELLKALLGPMDKKSQ